MWSKTDIINIFKWYKIQWGDGQIYSINLCETVYLLYIKQHNIQAHVFLGQLFTYSHNKAR